jgi:hypothetical protein
MKVTFQEISVMLNQFARAATSTRDKCQANLEAGYDVRRAADVAHAQGRIAAVLTMQGKLEGLKANADSTKEIDSELFLSSFASEAADTARLFAARACGDFHTLFGQTEAYNDVTAAIQAWELVTARSS